MLIAPLVGSEGCNDLAKQLAKETKLQGRMFYFAFGSNMLDERVRIRNPSMRFLGVGKLEDYRFSFTGYAEIWKGAVANIEPCSLSCVYGAVYSMDINQLNKLNEQEVGFDLHRVSLWLDGVGKLSNVATYIQKKCNSQELSEKPSKSYKMCCVIGAQKRFLPEEYVDTIIAWPDNGISGVGPEELRNIIP